MSKIMSKNRNFRDRAGFLFQRWGTWVCRHPFLVIAASLAVGAIGIGQLPELRADFSTEAMLQPDDPALSIYDDFRSEFERDDTLVIALAPPEVFDLEFLETLRAFHTALENELPYVDDITSLINARSTRGDQERLIVEELMVDWPENAEDLAHLRAQVLANPIYANTLISRQADLTMIVIQPQVYASDEGVSALSGFDESEGEAAFLSEDALNEMVQSAR
ncbi:MAG: Fis family transcriptional regulator, partial [bacterium]|nr:Fis family transcriptional regulator [bacterium]